MLKKVRMWLLMKGYMKFHNVSTKIEFIMYYNDNYYNLLSGTYICNNKDIKKDIKYIENILNFNPNEYMHDLLTYSKEYTSIQDWISEDGYVLHKPNSAFRVWLVMVDTLITTYYKYTKDLSSGKAYSNFKRIQTYIINTEYIIDSLVKITLSQR